jgi:hypothetical protein
MRLDYTTKAAYFIFHSIMMMEVMQEIEVGIIIMEQYTEHREQLERLAKH